MNFRDFAQHKFDMLLAMLLFVVVCLMLVHFSHDDHDTQGLNWALHAADLILGAIIGGVTVSRGQRADKGNGNDTVLPKDESCSK